MRKRGHKMQERWKKKRKIREYCKGSGEECSSTKKDIEKKIKVKH